MRIAGWTFVALTVFVLTALMASPVFAMKGMDHSGMNHASELNNLFSDETQPYMFSASPIGGCDDFHCRKCGDRNHCTGRPNCSMAGCGHQHGLVRLNDGVLFYLRTADGIRNAQGQLSCLSRAQGVAERLNASMKMMDEHKGCYLTVLDENRKPLGASGGDPVVWFAMAGGENYHEVVKVTSSDLAGYTYRSASTGLSKMAKPREGLSKELVARWWSALLQDYFGMVVESRPPQLTINTHCGRVLKTIWDRARAEVPKDKIPKVVFKRVIDQLSEEEKTRLFIAAQIVPDSFEPAIR